MTFGRKLGAGFVIIVLLTIASGAIAYFAMHAVQDETETVLDGAAANLVDAQRMLGAIHREVAADRGYLLTKHPKYLDDLNNASHDFDVALKGVEGRRNDPQAKKLLAELRRENDAHFALIQTLVRNAKNGAAISDSIALIESKIVPKYVDFNNDLKQFVAHETAQLKAGRQTAAEHIDRNVQILTALAILAALLALIIGVWLTQTLNRQIGSSVQQVRSSSAELQAAATQQASGAREQATAMNEITTTIGELLVTSRQIAESAKRVSQIANETATGARDGDESVQAAQDSLASIRSQVEVIVDHMLDLGKKSQQIGGILQIINELAEQTNILAINATIEAAGAGEAGRRFAVVGDEIRKLADRVGRSTKEIRELIDEIRAAVNTTVMATETGSKTVDAATQRFSELTTAFGQIGEQVETTTDAAREIELSTKQQASAVEQVNVAVSNVAQATKETEASSGQTLQTASQLATLSDELLRLVRATPQTGA